MPLKTFLSAKHETINVSNSYHPCTHTNISRARHTEAANSSSQCAHCTQERQGPAPSRVPLSGSWGGPFWQTFCAVLQESGLAVEQLSLARGAQPTNLRDRTHAAAPVKFRAWRDKLVCFHFIFYFLLKSSQIWGCSENIQDLLFLYLKRSGYRADNFPIEAHLRQPFVQSSSSQPRGLHNCLSASVTQP